MNLQTQPYTENQLQKYAFHQVALPPWLTWPLSWSFSSVTISGFYSTSKLAQETFWGQFFHFCSISSWNEFCLVWGTLLFPQSSHLENTPQNKWNCWILTKWALLRAMWELSMNHVLPWPQFQEVKIKTKNINDRKTKRGHKTHPETAN